MYFQPSKPDDIKKRQSTKQGIQSFLKQVFKVSIKTFYRKLKGETLPK